MRALELRVERERQQPAFGRVGHEHFLDIDGGLRVERATAQDADAASAFGNEDAPIWRARERGRRVRLLRQHAQAELGTVGRGQQPGRGGVGHWRPHRRSPRSPSRVAQPTGRFQSPSPLSTTNDTSSIEWAPAFIGGIGLLQENAPLDPPQVARRARLDCCQRTPRSESSPAQLASAAD